MYEVQWRCNCLPDGSPATLPGWRAATEGRRGTLMAARARLADLVVINAQTRDGGDVNAPIILEVLRARALCAVLGEDICPDLRFSHRIVEVNPDYPPG